MPINSIVLDKTLVDLGAYDPALSKNLFRSQLCILDFGGCGMDIFEILIRDHKKVSEIFNQLGSTKDQTIREMLFLQLKEELDLHTQIEKTIFHPALMNLNGSSIKLDQSEEYFENVHDLLSELDDIPQEDRLWKRKLFELKLNFQNHVDEEDEVFSDARHMLSRAEIQELGLRAEEIKEWL